MSMRIDHLRARIMRDLDELADYLDEHPVPEYEELGRDLRAMRQRLRTQGHHIVAEPLPVADEEA